MMRTAAKLVIVTFLATASTAFVNAQNTQPVPSTLPTPNFVTQNQLGGVVHSMNDHIGRNGQRIAHAQHQLDDMTAAQKLQTGSLTALKNREDADQQKIAGLQTATKAAANSASDAQVQLSTIKTWLVALVAFFVVFLTVAVMLSRIYREKNHDEQKAPQASSAEHSVPQEMPEVVLYEDDVRFFEHDDVQDLRKLCEKLQTAHPATPQHPIGMTIVIDAKPDKGFPRGGEQSGYTAVFDETKSLEGQFPRVYFKNEATGKLEVMRLDQVRKHAIQHMGLPNSKRPSPQQPALIHSA